MDPKLPPLLRAAADAAARPNLDAERKTFLFDVLPRLLSLEGRLAPGESQGSRGARSSSHAVLMRERARLAALAKEAEAVREDFNAIAFSLGTLDPLIPLADAVISGLGKRVGALRDEFAGEAEQAGPSQEGEGEGEGEEAASRGGGKPGGGSKVRVSASETLRKREEKKRKREERRDLFDSFQSIRAGATAATGEGVAEAGEAEALVDEVLTQAARFREGSLPWAAKIIGVPVTADKERARRQYRQRARSFHPDVCRHARAQEAFALLQRAWEIFAPHASGESGTVV